jgi:hypothetical protein
MENNNQQINRNLFNMNSVTEKYLSLTTIFLLIFSAQCFTQNTDIDKLKFGGSSGMSPKNYSPMTDYYQYYYNETVDSTAHCCPQTRIKKYFEFITEKSRLLIVDRAGIDFYNTLILKNFVIIYPNYKEFSNFYDIKYNIDIFDEVIYWVVYSYFHNSKVEYGFGVELNKNGECISEIQIPKQTNNRSFRNIISFNKALEIAREHLKSKPIESVSLEYCAEINSFCWLVTEDYKPQIQRKIGENKIQFFNNTFEIELLYINAQNGTIVKSETMYGGIDF